MYRRGKTRTTYTARGASFTFVEAAQIAPQNGVTSIRFIEAVGLLHAVGSGMTRGLAQTLHTAGVPHGVAAQPCAGQASDPASPSLDGAVVKSHVLDVYVARFDP